MRPNYFIVFGLLLCFATNIFCQNKGVVPVVSKESANNGTIRAVIIGVSDYQDINIPDLHYAHRDAEAFSDYLQNRPVYSVLSENIRLLKNEEATTAAVVAAFDWLLNESVSGDEAIIFFSGHGDVETKTRGQLGFWLTWDSPAKAYMAGAYPLFYLQNVVSTLSLDSDVKTIMIVDACRAGKLAGTEISGAQLTNANLAQQYGKEIKFLSCQPDEYSQESKQWGGGRGVFSHFLTEGLKGAADKNNNREINLLEISRYLEDNVMEQVDPAIQTPLILGSKTEIIAHNTLPFSSTGSIVISGGPNQEPYAKESTSNNFDKKNLTPANKKTYSDFYEKINGSFDYTILDSLFRNIDSEKAFVPILPKIKEDYAVALQDEVQQALNALLESDPFERNQYLFTPEKYHLYPDYLQRSIELLGEDHYSVPSLRAKQYFFKAYDIIRMLSESDKFDKKTRDELRIKPARFLDSAITIQPDAAYLYFGKMMAYGFRTPPMIDSMVYYCQKANEYSPKWLLPYLTLSGEYMANVQNIDKAEEWLLKAQEIAPESYVVLEQLVWLYQTKGQTNKALPITEKMIELRPDLFNGYGNKGNVLFQEKKYPEAKVLLEKAFEIDNHPRNFVPQFLGYVYMATRQKDKGINLFEKMLSDERTPYWMKASYLSWYGKALVDFTDNFEKAEKVWKEALERRHSPSTIAECLIWLAKISLQTGNRSKAEELLTKAFEYEDHYCNAFIIGYALLGEIEDSKGNLTKAESYFKKALDYPGDNNYKEEALFRYGNFLLKKSRDNEAEQQYQVCNYLTGNRGFRGFYGLAKYHSKNGNTLLALENLEKALIQFFPKKNLISEEPLFDEIRKETKFKDLMKQHFE